MIKYEVSIKGANWTVCPECHSFYAVSTEAHTILRFTAEYRNGLQADLYDGFFNTATNRHYRAHRFCYKMYGIVTELAFEMLKHGEVWDYHNNCNALVSYKKDVTPYYNRCKALGMPITEFTRSLFKKESEVE